MKNYTSSLVLHDPDIFEGAPACCRFSEPIQFRESFGPIRNYQDYRQKTSLGFDIMSNSSVVICGIARDCEKALINPMIPITEKLISFFRDYRIIMYENDSKMSSGDNTAEVLKEWGEKHDGKSHIVCENLNQKRPTGIRPARPTILGELRDKYLKHIMENMSDIDYMIVIDWDFKIRPWSGYSINGIANSLGNGHEINWGAFVSHGIFKSTMYWDTFAHMEPGRKTRYDRRNQGTVRRKYREMKIGDPICRVGSAFNGLGIYKVDSLFKCFDKYGYNLYSDGQDKQDQMINNYHYSENCNLHHKLNSVECPVFFNPSQTVIY